jgi:hypothetical protein
MKSLPNERVPRIWEGTGETDFLATEDPKLSPQDILFWEFVKGNVRKIEMRKSTEVMRLVNSVLQRYSQRGIFPSMAWEMSRA